MTHEQSNRTIRLAAALAMVMMLAAAPARATVIDFDDGIEDAAIDGFYSGLGVTFANAAFRFNFGLLGVSGRLGLGSTDNGNAYKWTAATPVVATFASAMSLVSLAAIDLGENGFTLNAYDAAVGGNLVGTQTLFGVGLGNNTFPTLSVAAASIFRVEMFQVQDISVDGLIVEAFRFEPAVQVSAPAAGLLLLPALLVLAGRRRRAGQPT